MRTWFLFIAAVLLGLSATLWNPTASALHERISDTAPASVTPAPGDPTRPE